jgi:hypothetical protein
MIAFRCWYCGKTYLVKEDQIGVVRECSCSSRIKVPADNGGNSRSRTFLEWLIEISVYGGGGALLGFGLALLLLRWMYMTVGRGVFALRILGGCTLAGFIAGAIFGEAGITWVGQFIREYEEKR